MRVELHPEARAEFRSAAVWYDEQRLGLGDEFVADVTETFARIAEAPHSYALWPRRFFERLHRSVRKTRRPKP